MLPRGHSRRDTALVDVPKGGYYKVMHLMHARFTLKKEDINLLERLVSICAVSGHEDIMIDFVYSEFKKYIHDVLIDSLGNVMATACKNDAAPNLMIFAHMDEVGFCVSDIEPNGFLRVQRIGGVNLRALLGQRVIICTDKGQCVPGIIGVTSHHLTRDEERHQIPDISELYVDVGATSAADVAEIGIKIGNAVGFARSFQVLHGTYVLGPALDNRIGLFVLIKLAEYMNTEQINANVSLVATVQEEFNLQGILPVVRRLAPNAAVCLDVAVAADTPDLRGRSPVKIGGGPVLSLLSFHGRGTLAGLVPNPGLVSFIEKVAHNLGIALQRQAVIGWLTDSSFLAVENYGVPAVDVAVPLRYTHTPVEMAKLSDIENCVNLMLGVIHNFSNAVHLQRGIIQKEGADG